MPGKWDWLKDEMGGVSKITKFSTVMKFLKGRVSGPDDMTKCAMCPNMCRHACPISIVDGKETTSPAGKSRVGMMVEHDVIPMDEENLYPIHICLSCGCCEKWCPFDFSVSEILKPEKERGIDEGVVFEQFQEMFDNLENYGLVQGGIKEERSYPDEGNILYLRGCEFRGGDEKVIGKTMGAFEKLGLDAFVLSDEECCGIPAYNAGNTQLFKELARKMAKKIDDSGAEKVITSCPSCAYAYRKLYPEFGLNMDVEVLHIVEFLDRKKNMKGKKKATVTFHDPCKLVNGLENNKGMEDVLEKLGLDVKVPRRSGDETFCCGYGGSTVCRLNEGLSSRISEERLDELSSLSDKIITSCPTCKKAFEENGDEKVYDIGELLYELL